MLIHASDRKAESAMNLQPPADDLALANSRIALLTAQLEAVSLENLRQAEDVKDLRLENTRLLASTKQMQEQLLLLNHALIHPPGASYEPSWGQFLSRRLNRRVFRLLRVVYKLPGWLLKRSVRAVCRLEHDRRK